VLAGYVNAFFLVFMGFFIFVEAFERVLEPPEIISDQLVLVSAAGIHTLFFPLALFLSFFCLAKKFSLSRLDSPSSTQVSV
jgi:Co/Zn/Cd efflux system component